MTNHYTTLGVDKNATQDEIKKAYKKLANKHHPDKGGNQNKFKEIVGAYDVIGDNHKRAEYDQQQLFGDASFHNYDDMFTTMFNHSFGGPFSFNQRHVRRNKDLTLQCQISLLDSFNGKNLEAKYKLLSGQQQTAIIDIPPGINHGDTIKYLGLGDDTFKDLSRGDLHVTILINQDKNYHRYVDDLHTSIEINPIEAMIGCVKEVKSLTGEPMTVTLRPGVKHGTEYAKQGAGFKNMHSGRTGRFVATVDIKVPVITEPELLKQLTEINDKLNNR